MKETIIKILKNIIKFCIAPLILLYLLWIILKDRKINVISSDSISVENSSDIDKDVLKNAIDKGNDILSKVSKD